MGSPNFYTGNEVVLNTAIDFDLIAKKHGFDASDEHDYEPIREIASVLYEQAQSLISEKIGTLFFHSVELCTGYHEGFQIYLTENYHQNPSQYKVNTLNDWEQYKIIMSTDGYEFDLGDLVLNRLFRSNAVNVTPFALEQAMKKEYKILHNTLVEIAQELGLGEVTGQSWTSSVIEGSGLRKI